MGPLDIKGKITGIRYTPLLGRVLNKYSIKDFEKALAKEATFILTLGKNKELVISWWVSAKRTRSYPFARVYDSLSFPGRKATIIPIFKDEGAEGDRDFLQWDTISLMSLLGVYVIISYYKSAEKSSKYGNVGGNKIDNQRFNVEQISFEINKLLSYQSDALHWNLEQINNIKNIGYEAINSYKNIAESTGVKMHVAEGAEKRIYEIISKKDAFMNKSRFLAKNAQSRESKTLQPKENVDGSKAKITITNYLKGKYFFTCDESEIKGKDIFLIEAKHSSGKGLPAISDLKDGLIKMILFTNLEKVNVGDKLYNVKPVLKLTSEMELTIDDKILLNKLKKEANKNNFLIKLNEK